MDARGVKRRLGALMAHPLLARFFLPLTRGRATIFMLHRMADPAERVHGHEAAVLRGLLELLRRQRYNIVSLDDLFTAMEEGEPINGVAFTLDDGYLDQATVAAPIFAAYDAPATFFLISRFLDGKLLPWDMRAAWAFEQTRRPAARLALGEATLEFDLATPAGRRRARDQFLLACKRMPAAGLAQALAALGTALELTIPKRPVEGWRPMSWEDARRLERQGFSFGPHSATHGILARMTAADVFREISESTRRLQEELARPLDLFCYPTGRYSDFGEREVCILQQLGMRGAVSAEPGYATARGPNGRRSRFHLRRFALPARVHEAVQYCAGIERAKELVRSPLAWRV